MPKSDIVFGSEFSPAVIDLPKLLDLVMAYKPDRRALQAQIDRVFFSGKGKTKDPRKTLGDNTVLSLTEYGIIQRDGEEYSLTSLGMEMYSNRADTEALKSAMARQCLLNLRGLEVIQAIDDLFAGGIALTKLTLTKRLREEGLHIPENGKHLNVLRQWLEYGGVLNPSGAKGGDDLWRPDSDRIKQILGVPFNDFQKWRDLTPVQRDFARAFALLGVKEASSSEVRNQAVALYGTEFPEGGLPQSVLHKLEDVGLIKWEKTTGGRGAKAHKVYATDILRSDYLEPILKQTESDLGPGFTKLLRMPFSAILHDLNSSDRHVKGLALEALALYFLHRLDLKFAKWRLRGTATGGAEVDLVVEGARLQFSRWQIQCKNSKSISLEDLAKEVGIATAIRSNVILMIGTGEVGDAVRRFARSVMQNTSLHIAVLSKRDLQLLTTNAAALTDILNTQARDAMAIKKTQLEE